ncbi:MAG: peptidylprolyl isomerase [Anaerolineae bacterium]|nr:peptidylprolyl isomerase [Anaerolineae bacterium]MDW8173927.1 peptidylprolyl isomerase [Anaerolineae bacterium]
MAHRLTNNMVGSIAYKLTVDGQLIEDISPQDAIEYLHGAENIVPGLEAALQDKTVGDTFSVVVPPSEGYGDYDEEDIAQFPRSDFEEADALEVGMEIEFDMDEDDEDGIIEVGKIIDLDEDTVTVDFNHPLAGKTLHYDVQVVEVRPATEEELALGVPESMFDMFEDDFEDDEQDQGYKN